MSESANSSQFHPQLEAFANLEAEHLQVRAGYRTSAPEVVAGGPIEIEAFIENIGQVPLYLAIGSDRAKLRPSFFSFEAVLEETDVELEDPLEGVPQLGGPATVITVEPGTYYQQVLLVNEFAALEKIPTVLAPGELGVLRIRCRRPLPLALNKEQAFQNLSNAPMLDKFLTVYIRRNDAALKELIAQLATKAHNNWNSISPVEREKTISQLFALRSPMVIPYLEMLIEHPDGSVRLRAQRSLAWLQQNT